MPEPDVQIGNFAYVRWQRMTLEKTYQDPQIHNQWRQVYHTDQTQSQFDEAIYEWLFKTLKPRGIWLDAGCGPGEHSVRIARFSRANVLAIDISNVALQLASATIESAGLSQRIRLECHALEKLPTSLGVDNVHSRGVLMHIPQWRLALANLCSSVRAGGYLVLFENNCRSFELAVVRAMRWFRKSRSRMVATDGGVEFWSVADGKLFVARAADTSTIVEAMKSHGIHLVLQRTIGLFDIYRVPAFLRPTVIALNRIWFRWNLPFGSGVLLVGRRPVSTSRSDSTISPIETSTVMTTSISPVGERGAQLSGW